MEKKMTSDRLSLLKILSSVVFLVFSVAVFGQEEQDRASREAEKYLKEAEEAIDDKDFQSAEAFYRQAIAKDPSNTAARYNMGNLYYNEEIPKDAVERHSQAAELATGKSMKHRSFHNQGNAYMKQEDYPDAIEAYKNALRNNPEDEETRYNLALAKKMLEEEQKGGGGDDSEDQENEDQDQESENQDEQGDGKKDQSEEGDQENKDEQEGQGEEDDQKQPEDDQQKDQEGKNPEEPNQPQQQQPIPGQLTPQQIQNLLEAMGNEEKKVQDKINAEKARGAKTKSEKDW